MDKKILLPVIALSLATISCHHSSPRETDVTETVDVALPVVDTITLSTVYPGYLTANNSVNVVAKVNGQILTKNYPSGTHVKKGDVLFTIDPSTYQDQLKQAQASLSTAMSERDYAHEHYEAVKKALESDAVSKMEVEQAHSSLVQAEASVKNANAALETARRLLSYCTVTAPITGQIASATMSDGAYVSGQGSPVVLTTIYDNSVMQARFSIEDDRYHELLNMQHNNKDSIDFEHIPVMFEVPLPHSYTGSMFYIAPALNSSTGTLQLRCLVDNPYDELREGMYVKVDLPYDRIPDAILVKDASIGSDQQGKYLYVVNDSNKVVYTPVKVGEIYHDSLRVVTSGIKPTDRYVTKAMLKVRDGMTVNPKTVK